MTIISEIWQSFVDEIPKEERWGMYAGIPMIAVGAFMLGVTSQIEDPTYLPEWATLPLIFLVVIGIGLMIFASEAREHLEDTEESETE